MPGYEKGLEVLSLPCRQRVDAEEFIDQPETPIGDISGTIRDQAMVNRWLGGAYATMVHLLPLLRTCTSGPLRVLDVACGGGDLSRMIVDRARKIGKRVEITALDLNETTIECARRSSSEYPEITFVHGDALHPPFGPSEFDVVVLATFLHHLAPDKVVDALRVAKNLSRRAVIATDLVRSPLAYWGIRIFARLAHFNPISAHDGAVSVCRAYTPPELAALAERAGLGPSQVYRHKFYRMAVVYEAGRTEVSL